MKLGHHRETLMHSRDKWFQNKLPQYLIEEADVVISYDTFSWILAARCLKVGKPFILDASIAHPIAKEQVYDSIRRRFPAWAAQVAPKREKYIALEVREMKLATQIVVASQFTKSTYVQNGVDSNKIFLNAYGINQDFFKSKWQAEASLSNGSQSGSPIVPAVRGGKSAALVFYFFGTVNARKGIPWLCEVWARFNSRYPNCRLILAGYGKVPKGFDFPEGVERIGFVHPQDRLQHFHKADVFVFPSYFEGFAQVIIEALACGLPVITTTHTAGPDFVTPGAEGFVVTPGEDDELMEAMSFFAENADCIEPMGRQARRVVEGYTWDAYGTRWKTILDNINLPG
jgi:glycosyltransferase involved in cell wall biosynthesis